MDIYNFFSPVLKVLVSQQPQRPLSTYKTPVENGSKLLSRSLVNYYSVSSRFHIASRNPQTTDHFLYVLFFNRSMRATIFNVCAILSLFSVAIHAAPPFAPRTIPECPIQPIIGIGPVCSPRPTPTPYPN